MAADYLPKSLKNLRDWLRIQKEGIPEIGGTIGMTDAEQKEYLAIIDSLLTDVTAIVDLTEQVDHRSADFEIKLAEQQPLLRRHVKRAKTSAGCTPGILQRMGWNGERNEIDPAASAPAITLTALAGRIKVEGSKPGFEAVNLYMRRKDAAEWKLMAIRKRKFPIYDDTPLAQAGVPEVREYRAIGVVSDEEIGLPSQVMEVVFIG